MEYLALDERVTEAFPPGVAASFGPQYLGALLDNWRGIAKSLRTCLSFLVALVILFLALRNVRSARISVGPLQLNNVSDVLMVVPLLVSLLTYEAVGLIAAYAMYRETVKHVVCAMHPTVHQNNMELMLAPPMFSLIGGGGRNWEDIQKTKPGVSRHVLNATAVAVFAVIWVGSFAFLLFAYLNLYADRHVAALAVTASLAGAVVYAARSLALLVHTAEQY
jgi:hypothetical protein